MAESHRRMAIILEKMRPFPIPKEIRKEEPNLPRHHSTRETPIKYERKEQTERDEKAEKEEKTEAYDTESVADTELGNDFYLRSSGSDDPVYIYRSACKRYRVVPSVNICRQLPGTELCIDNFHIGEKSIMAIALSLVNNYKISVLKLACNCIGREGIRFLCEVLKENTTVSYIDISDNDLGTHGAVYLSSMLMVNTTLHSLIASGNNFKENDAAFFATALQRTVDLHYLNLSHNEFRELGGVDLGKALGNNASLEFLDLSWNHLRLKGGVQVAKGLQENRRLKVLNLSWNGLGNDGAKALGCALHHNESLLELDVTCNRINMEGTVALAEGLRSNSTLKWFKLSKNPVTTTGACCLLRVLLESESSGLHTLELLDIEVNPAFEQMLEELRALRVVDVIHGGHVRHSDPYAKRTGKKEDIMGDPLALLMEFVKKSSLRLMDLFAQLDKDNSMSLTKTEFKRGMKIAKVPLNDIQIDKLIDNLDLDKDGEINFAELLDGQRRYRERERRKTQLPTTALMSSRQKSSERPKSGAPVPRAKAPSLTMASNLGESTLGQSSSSGEYKPTSAEPLRSLPVALKRNSLFPMDNRRPSFSGMLSSVQKRESAPVLVATGGRLLPDSGETGVLHQTVEPTIAERIHTTQPIRITTHKQTAASSPMNLQVPKLHLY